MSEQETQSPEACVPIRINHFRPLQSPSLMGFDSLCSMSPWLLLHCLDHWALLLSWKRSWWAPSLVVQSWIQLLTLGWVCFCHLVWNWVHSSGLDLSGVDMSPLALMVAVGVTGTVILLPLWVTDGKPRKGCPTRGVPLRGKSSGRGIRGEGVPPRWTGLLVRTWTSHPSELGAALVVAMSSPHCMAVVSILYIWQMGTTKEVQQGSNLIESIGSAMEKISKKMTSSLVAISTCFSSCFFTSLRWRPSHVCPNSCVSTSSSHSCWIFACWWSCSHQRAGWHPDSLGGCRGYWHTSSPPPCSALASHIVLGQPMPLRPPSLTDNGGRRWSPCPGQPPHSIRDKECHESDFYTDQQASMGGELHHGLPPTFLEKKFWQKAPPISVWTGEHPQVEALQEMSISTLGKE